VLELKTCNSEDEFWAPSLKDKMSSQEDMVSPEKIGSGFYYGQDIFPTQKPLKKIRTCPQLS
jgi:hypothetical protein